MHGDGKLVVELVELKSEVSNAAAAFRVWVAGADCRCPRRRCRRFRLHGGMAISPQRLHAEEDRECAGAADRRGARPSPGTMPKGICFTGVFAANGAGSALSKAQVFSSGQYPVLGRFNLATADPNAPDATVRVRGIGLRISTPDGQQWRSAMIDPPVFPVSTPRAFYELLLASKSKDPNAMKTFAGAHPEIAAFGAWAKNAPWTGSYAEERFSSLDSFVFTEGSGAEHTVRWSLLPAVQPVAVSPADLAKRGPDFLEQEIAERVRGGPQRWTMVVTIACCGRSHPRRSEQGLARRSPHRRGRHARCPAGRSRCGTARASTSALRSDRPAVRHEDGRTRPGSTVGCLCEVIRPAHGGG